MMEVLELNDLETKGFVLVRGFLSEAELQPLREDFARQQAEVNGNYHSKAPGKAAIAGLMPRIEDVMRQVNACTTLKVDVHVPDTSSYFATHKEAGNKFPWHQDHESFYLVQNHRDYLNFYMPIIKPDPTKSNLSLIPFDELKKRSPRTHDFVVHSGAGTFRPLRTHWLASNDDTGGVHLITANLDDLGYTPELVEGDLLIMRGDVIHRTQDQDTDRVALSWRVANGDTTVRRARLAGGGVRKSVMMRKHTVPYQKMFDAFDAAKKDEMSLREMYDVYATIPSPEPTDEKTFQKKLFAEKRRAHVLHGYIANLPVAAGLRGFDHGLSYLRGRRQK